MHSAGEFDLQGFFSVLAAADKKHAEQKINPPQVCEQQEKKTHFYGGGSAARDKETVK